MVVLHKCMFLIDKCSLQILVLYKFTFSQNKRSLQINVLYRSIQNQVCILTLQTLQMDVL